MCTIEWEWVSEGRGGGGNEDGAACSLCPRPRPPVLWLPEQCPGTISAPPQFGLSALDDCFALIRNFPSSWDRLRQFYAFWRIPHGKRGNWKQRGGIRLRLRRRSCPRGRRRAGASRCRRGRGRRGRDRRPGARQDARTRDGAGGSRCRRHAGCRRGRRCQAHRGQDGRQGHLRPGQTCKSCGEVGFQIGSIHGKIAPYAGNVL